MKNLSTIKTLKMNFQNLIGLSLQDAVNVIAPYVKGPLIVDDLGIRLFASFKEDGVALVSCDRVTVDYVQTYGDDGEPNFSAYQAEIFPGVNLRMTRQEIRARMPGELTARLACVYPLLGAVGERDTFNFKNFKVTFIYSQDVGRIIRASFEPLVLD